MKTAVYKASEAGLDPTFKWYCSCERHNNFVGTSTRKAAESAGRATWEWCEGCREEMGSAPKHTPGPWGEITDEFGRCERGIDYPEGDDRDHFLATVQCGDPDELLANTRLIQAAPEMLVALQACTRAYEDAIPADQKWIAGTNLVPHWYAAARAAIAKAQGEQQ